MARKTQRILVADDDPIYRDVATEALEKSGHLITVAKDGGEALELLSSETFDAAIVDLSMPVADGLEVIAKLRAGVRNAQIPVIVITGHDDAAAVERAYLAGATSFLTKPLNWVLFTPHVEFVLRSGQIEADLREASAAAAFLSDLKSQMMSSLAREFQAPIKTIVGFSELINKEVYGPITPPNYRELTVDIGKSAHHLHSSLLRLMDFGRTLTEQLSINEQDFDARDALLDAIAALEKQAQRRDIKIKANINIPTSLKLKADKALLSQALRSLLDNAIRLAPRGSEVEVHAGLTADRDFGVWTSDKGPQVPSDLVAEINGSTVANKSFAPQLETRDVGIKIAKILTEAHQGCMKIHSEAGGMNIVRLELPRARVLEGAGQRETIANTGLQERFAAIGEALAHDLRASGRTPQAMPASTSRPQAPLAGLSPAARLSTPTQR